MKKRFKYLVGVDEAGRGALCGPVVASCVCFKKRISLKARDSKEMSPKKREEIFKIVTKNAHYSFGLVREDIIDKINIFWASQLAFVRAMERFLKTSGLNKKDTLFIIDGPSFKHSGYNHKCVIAADKTVKVVSCASVLAKVMRDRIMRGYDNIFKGYKLSQHKGYGTKEHRLILKKQGATPIHRMSFNLGI